MDWIGAAILNRDIAFKFSQSEQNLIGQTDAGVMANVIKDDRSPGGLGGCGREMLEKPFLQWSCVIRRGDQKTVDWPISVWLDLPDQFACIVAG